MKRFANSILCAAVSVLALASTALRVSAFQDSPQQEKPPAVTAISERMRHFVDDHEIAGAVTLVATPDRIVHLDATGMADIALNKRMRPDAIFWIASMTKPITATAVLMLQDEGKLSVDDPVEKYLPEFKGSKTADGKPASLTIRHLLTHTSGMGEVTPDQARAITNLAGLIPLYVAKPLAYEPGTKWVYCQSGINTAARVVEVVSGELFDQFVASRLFGPLGMKDTTFYLTEQQLPRLATSYLRTGKGELEATQNFILYGKPATSRERFPAANGGLFSTATDYARFCQMILSGGELGGRRFVKPESVKLMTTIQTGELTTGFTPGNGWGLGWCVIRKPQGVTATLSSGTFGHGGAYGTQAWIDPEKKRIYLLMVQRANFPNSDASEVRRGFQESAASTLESARWEREIRAFEREDLASRPPQGAIVFIGSSSTRLWKTLARDFPEHKVINRGFGGSQIADAVYYADRVVIPYKPKLVVLQAGSNDLNAGKTPERVSADFRAFVERVRARLPETRIAFVSISPAPVRWAQADRQKAANSLIHEYIRAGKDLDYIELWDQFLGPDGKPGEDLFLGDRLHNNPAGYKIRAAAVRPHLAEFRESGDPAHKPGALESHAAPARLIVRGDDMGFSHAGNEAILKCFKEGIETSIEVIVPSPWFPEAAKMLAENSTVDVGIHLALSSEWDNVKWRPLADVPSLRDEDGYFYPMIFPNKNYPKRSLRENSWTLGDVETEFRAQIELAKKRIPRVSHISGHMGCDAFSPEVKMLARKLAKEFGLDIEPSEQGVAYVSYAGRHATAGEKAESFLKMLGGLKAGKTYLFVDHPGLDTPELRAIHHVGYEQVAADRQGVTDAWTDPRVRELIKTKGIQLISYKDLKN
jgi:CubicO group peptidase (beta-lactamase class C family)/predicted glycoside hydrolase/deacetylase ChbG (UPF0249 family)/lysophospholipase L1-like esterase